MLKLSIEEVLALREYFYKRAGYISPEFDGELFPLLKKLDYYAENGKEQEEDKETSEK